MTSTYHFSNDFGHHASLIAAKGAYYNLVKNQLELGN